MLEEPRSLNSQRNTERTKNVNQAGEYLQQKRQKSNACISSRKLRVDFVNDLMTFLLSVESDLALLLLSKSPKMIIPDSPLPRPLSILKEDVTCLL